MLDTEPGPLAGVRVIEFAGLAPISVVGMLLCDMGADVVRIDRRDHSADIQANTLRRGRRSVILDLKDRDGLDAAKRLVAASDVLIEAYRPGVMERLGLGPDVLQAATPSLIYGRLTGWGQTGPITQAAGHDITYLAITGALHPVGPFNGPPTPPLNYVADMAGGAMFLVMGVLAALHERHRSGLGQVVDAAMVDGVPIIAATLIRGIAQGLAGLERGSNILDGSAPFYRCYECSDGGYIAVGAIESQFYAAFVHGLGLDLDDLPAQHDRASWPEVSERFAHQIRRRPRAVWESTFADTDACVAPVLNLEEAVAHPHLQARRTFIESNGAWQPGVAPALSRTRLRATGEVPRPGADTREVLSELGITGAVLEALVVRGSALPDPADVS